MSALSLLMAYYPYLFHPAVTVGGGTLLLMYVEWRREGAGRGALRRRFGTLAALGALALLPSLAYMLVAGQGPMETMQGNAWQVDFLVGSGMVLVAGAMWLLWQHAGRGPIVPAAMEALVGVTLPYLALSPFWNISGHVIFATTPALALALVDRRFRPLLAVPAVMVLNRVYLDVHTWGQSVGGLLLASAVVVWVFERRLDGGGTTRN